MIKSDWPLHFSAATLREEEEFFADLGVFEIETYRQAKYAPAALIRLVQQFRERRAIVVILLMPEHSTLARQIPAEALDVFQHHLSEAFGDSPPPVLDLRRSIGDDGFVDLVHLNRSGSGEFSRLLAGRIQRTLPTGPALMAHRPGDHSATSGQGSSSRGSQ
jgi:hypothetical protein